MTTTIITVGGRMAAEGLAMLDPTAFSGEAAFTRQTARPPDRQTAWLADACRINPPRPGVERVRLPGESAAGRKHKALADGVRLHQGVFEKLLAQAAQLGVEAGPA